MKLKMFVMNSLQLCYLHRIAPLIKQPKEMKRNRIGLTVAHTPGTCLQLCGTQSRNQTPDTINLQHQCSSGRCKSFDLVLKETSSIVFAMRLGFDCHMLVQQSCLLQQLCLSPKRC